MRGGGLEPDVSPEKRRFFKGPMVKEGHGPPRIVSSGHNFSSRPRLEILAGSRWRVGAPRSRMSDLWHLTLITTAAACPERGGRRDGGDAPAARLGGRRDDSRPPSTSAPSNGWRWFTSSTCSAFLCWGTAEAWREALTHFRLAPIPTAVARAPAELTMLGDAERCVTMGARSWLRPW